MARCEVIQIQCDRCKRVELRAPTPPKANADLDLLFLGQRIKFDDCCERCKEALKRLMGFIQEWDREVKQHFGPTVHSNQAPPTEVAPNYTPAQPHAAVAGRR